jgi:hypothetical protein
MWEKWDLISFLQYFTLIIISHLLHTKLYSMKMAKLAKTCYKMRKISEKIKSFGMMTVSFFTIYILPQWNV